MKKTFYLFAIISSNLFYSQNEDTIVELYADVTNDNKEEKIIIKELKEEGEYGKTRLLEIYKKNKNNWVIIASSKSAILSSEDGGMMGDPFDKENISVEKGFITIIHRGGSSWKWDTTHKYRFQNNKFDVPAHQTLVLDTTGAGDAFAGAFLYGMIYLNDLTKAANLATLLSSKVISQLGARYEGSFEDMISLVNS